MSETPALYQEVDARALADEMRTLLHVGKPCGVFSLGPWEAFVLVGALQGTSRNPMLSVDQRVIVVEFARQIAAELEAMAVSVLGPGSLLVRVTEAGFDPSQDIPRVAVPEQQP